MMRLFKNSDAARANLLARHINDSELPAAVRDGLNRIFGREISAEKAVAEILSSVADGGDQALRQWTERIDGLNIKDFVVPEQQIDDAWTNTTADLRSAINTAAERIRDFHQRQRIDSWTTSELGGTLGQRITPLKTVGIYVPGGSAPLPSSLLMAAVPAQVAGVSDIVVCTPPGQPNGTIPDVTLAAAHAIGIKNIFRIGGAQAIAAMAYGTATVPKVDKIVGPGNLFVTLAKKQVFGLVGLDGLAGPTETVVIADESANPAWLAADLLAQAEHDALATAILLTDSQNVVEKVQREVKAQIDRLSRGDIAAESLAHRGGIVLVESLEEAVDLSNEFAPEHLCLSVKSPALLAERVTNAGGIFIGEQSCEVLGDYVAGPSHIMPTNGTARFSSPVNVMDFVKVISIIHLDDESCQRLSPAANLLASAEGLHAHAEAARLRSMERD